MTTTYTRNSNPKYWDSYRENANCGSFALDIKGSWFEFGEEWDSKIYKLFDEGFDERAVESEMLEWAASRILSTCKWVESVDSPDDVTPNEDLIAFRVGITKQDNDFHFRVRKNGQWFEKNGSGNVKPIKVWDIKNTWYGPDIMYNSDIKFFKFKADKI